MTCLYRIGDDICVELSYEAWQVIQNLIENCDWTLTLRTQTELQNFANMVRAHLQHPEPASKPAPSTNLDLI